MDEVSSHRAEAPFIADNTGSKLAFNRLRDPRVRRALSVGIDRSALTDRLMHGTGAPAGQWLPPRIFSHAPAIQAPPYDPGQAKQLLSDAGFPQGFRVTVHAPNDRYQSDAAIAQVLAKMWTRIGQRTWGTELGTGMRIPHWIS